RCCQSPSVTIVPAARLSRMVSTASASSALSVSWMRLSEVLGGVICPWTADRTLVKRTLRIKTKLERETAPTHRDIDIVPSIILDVLHQAKRAAAKCAQTCNPRI